MEKNINKVRTEFEQVCIECIEREKLIHFRQRVCAAEQKMNESAGTADFQKNLNYYVEARGYYEAMFKELNERYYKLREKTIEGDLKRFHERFEPIV